MSGLSFVAVTRRFPGVVALDEFTLDVGEGELVTFLGPSGCGKTTALRVAAGFESPDSGGVRLGARDITDLPAQRRNMGMVFQSYSLFPHLTVSENISFGLMVRGAPVPERAARAGEMMELVRITGLAERYPHQLSGGQQQRVALARALAFKPEVLLLDEPLSALDARVRTEVRDEIRSLQMTTGTTTIFVTHDQDEALAVSDRVCVMESGTVHQVASPMEIYQSPQTEFVARFVGESDTVLLRGRNILVRPEDLDITGGAGTGDFDATVVGVDFKGAWSNVVLETAVDRRKVRCSVTAGTSRDLKAGSLVGVCVKRELFALV